ncbi:Spermidine/putrescine import ATP-binding protein PotA [Neomoorella glycerini]|uniref:ABC-type quaternary amine transporter n=1 Tax=Neomoorella glycerini TaxID=55779 RepID=A0A6I5ZQR0_9FIRM|nr:ABC transporter ATP-binding protein [Moorella glycerini]QGP92333.1 Spermidine/putrescine import ATP-binding protein PotA [Moorella glycerini]
MTAIRVEKLEKWFGRVRALDGISLDIQPGTLVAILGPSGCGKTTLLRCLAGFTAVDGGQVLFDGEDVTHLPPHLRQTALVFQNYALWPHMTIFDNIAYGLRLKKLPRREVQSRVEAALALTELNGDPDLPRRRPAALSGGQQQRVALARALAVEPRVLLLDEPLSNLDARVRQRLRVEIRCLQKKLGITTVHVTHDQEEALSMADTVVIMNGGRIEQVGRPAEVFQRPASAFVAEFLGNSNTLPGRVLPGGALEVAGQRLPGGLALPPDAATVTVVIRAGDITLRSPGTSPAEGQVVLAGVVEDVLFQGNLYRHTVVVGRQTIVADATTPSRRGPVLAVIPAVKVFVFPVP